MMRLIPESGTIRGNDVDIRSDDNPICRYVHQAERAFNQVVNIDGHTPESAAAIIQAAALFAVADAIDRVECQIDNTGRRICP